MTTLYKAGDFSGLASDYSKYRPDYSLSVLKSILGYVNKEKLNIDFVDVGAGTGIWTKMVYESGVASVIAVEPNDDMFSKGVAANNHLPINWVRGDAEHTSLPSNSADWVSMASSFHWANFNLATKEFHRLLRPRGVFTAIWNPRLIEVNPMLVEIEDNLAKLKSNIKRVSSGRSGITENLADMLWSSPYFEDVVYIEGRHVIEMLPERYLGAWRSVNDLRVQLGEEKFNQFLAYVEEKISNISKIEATYWTRSWSARRKD